MLESNTSRPPLQTRWTRHRRSGSRWRAAGPPPPLCNWCSGQAQRCWRVSNLRKPLRAPACRVDGPTRVAGTRVVVPPVCALRVARVFDDAPTPLARHSGRAVALSCAIGCHNLISPPAPGNISFSRCILSNMPLPRTSGSSRFASPANAPNSPGGRKPQSLQVARSEERSPVTGP